MIGDQKSDIQFAKNAKIKSAFFTGGNLYSFVKNLKFNKKF
jgi:histidinol phosphatase-like enzyme